MSHVSCYNAESAGPFTDLLNKSISASRAPSTAYTANTASTTCCCFPARHLLAGGCHALAHTLSVIILILNCREIMQVQESLALVLQYGNRMVLKSRACRLSAVTYHRPHTQPLKEVQRGASKHSGSWTSPLPGTSFFLPLHTGAKGSGA